MQTELGPDAVLESWRVSLEQAAEASPGEAKAFVDASLEETTEAWCACLETEGRTWRQERARNMWKFAHEFSREFSEITLAVNSVVLRDIRLERTEHRFVSRQLVRPKRCVVRSSRPRRRRSTCRARAPDRLDEDPEPHHVASLGGAR